MEIISEKEDILQELLEIESDEEESTFSPDTDSLESDSLESEDSDNESVDSSEPVENSSWGSEYSFDSESKEQEITSLDESDNKEDEEQEEDLTEDKIVEALTSIIKQKSSELEKESSGDELDNEAEGFSDFSVESSDSGIDYSPQLDEIISDLELLLNSSLFADVEDIKDVVYEIQEKDNASLPVKELPASTQAVLFLGIVEAFVAIVLVVKGVLR